MSSSKSPRSNRLPCSKLITEREQAATELSKECKTVGYTPVYCVTNGKSLQEAAVMKPEDLTAQDYKILRRHDLNKQKIRHLYSFKNDAHFYKILKSLGVYPEPLDKPVPPSSTQIPVSPAFPDYPPINPPEVTEVWFTGRSEIGGYTVIISQGRITIGAGMGKELTAEYIQFGLTSNNHLKIRSSKDQGYSFHKRNGNSNRKSACCAELASELKMRGIKMPVTFLMQFHVGNNEWEGEIKNAK